uniref:Sulfotransfer_1 domain-containing protein n=1 Tax=Macrostomum lignano TaxID=282301 RepID=A0A1I8FJH6_9PLAT
TAFCVSKRNRPLQESVPLLTAHRSRSHDEALRKLCSISSAVPARFLEQICSSSVWHKNWLASRSILAPAGHNAPMIKETVFTASLQFSRTSALLKLMLKRLWFRLRRRDGNPRRLSTASFCRPPRNRSNQKAGKGEDAKDVDPALETEVDDEGKPGTHASRPVLELPVHYWFHIYLHSYDCDRLLTPFVKSMMEDFPTDRRLLSIMNRCLVRVSLGQLEMYKSLPRATFFILNGANWDSIIRALVEMEAAFPELLRFASHTAAGGHSAQRFSTSYWRQTAFADSHDEMSLVLELVRRNARSILLRISI